MHGWQQQIDEDGCDSASGHKKRIVDLDVDEVSGVDRPAIRREFLIAKGLENKSMGAFDTDEGQTVEVDKAEFDGVVEEVTKALGGLGFEFAEIDVEKALPPDLAAALKAAIPWMRKMAGEAEGDTRKAILRVVAFLSKVSGGQYPYPKPAGKQGNPFGKKPEEEEKKPKRKATSLDDDGNNDDKATTVIKMTPDGELEIVSKGRRFTASRTAALADSATKLLGLLKETDEETYKQVLSSIGKELPKDPKWTAGTTATGTQKSEDDGGDATAAAVTKALEDFGERLKAIEKARAPSQSVEGDGDTDSTSQVKKSLWSGLGLPS